MFMLIQRAETGDEAEETVTSMTLADDLSEAEETEAALAVTATVVLAGIGTGALAEETVTVVLEGKLMLRPSETEHLLTKNHTKMNSKNPDS